MELSVSGEAMYRSLGVRPIINASGTTTMWGGSKLRPEAAKVMEETSRVMVDLGELNAAAGRVLADICGAEAGLVVSGSGGGLVMQAAAVIAGGERARMARLPDSTGMKNEIIIHKSHRFGYDQLYRAAGAAFVEIGDGRRCYPWQLEAAFTENTAAVAYLVAQFTSRRAIPLPQVCEIAHARGVPVIVDAASTLPPRDNLRRFIREGADMVILSGGKGVRGPQGTGMLVGRGDLIEAAAANAAPNAFLGRSMKVAKEEIMGLIAALRLFAEEDEEAENARYRAMAQQVVDALIEVPGIRVGVRRNSSDYLVPTAIFEFDEDRAGPGRDEVLQAMSTGEPAIHLHQLGDPGEFGVDPINLDEAELEVVIRRLREELLRRAP